jgi:hypothetical protein
MTMSDKNGKSQQLQAGQRFYCQRCKSDSVVQVVHDIQGFQIISEKAICAFCKAEIVGAVLKPSTPRSDAADETPIAVVPDSTSALSSLLQLDSNDGIEKASLSGMLADTSGSDADATKSFCRDCYHYIHHPFLSRCSLHNRTVEPMDDCPSFLAKIRKQSDTGG